MSYHTWLIALSCTWASAACAQTSGWSSSGRGRSAGRPLAWHRSRPSRRSTRDARRLAGPSRTSMARDAARSRRRCERRRRASPAAAAGGRAGRGRVEGMERGRTHPARRAVAGRGARRGRDASCWRARRWSGTIRDRRRPPRARRGANRRATRRTTRAARARARSRERERQRGGWLRGGRGATPGRGGLAAPARRGRDGGQCGAAPRCSRE